MNSRIELCAKGGGVVRIRSDSLLGDAGRLIIVHRGDEYHLRKTRQGKLILTK